MYQTSHYPYHKPCGRGKFLGLFVDSRPVQKIVRGDERGGCTGYYGRGGLSSQDTSHYCFHNHVESFDGDVRDGHRSHTIHSPSHNTGWIGIFLGFSVHVDDISGQRFHTIHLPSHYHGG